MIFWLLKHGFISLSSVIWRTNYILNVAIIISSQYIDSLYFQKELNKH